MYVRNDISLTFLVLSVCILLMITPARAGCDRSIQNNPTDTVSEVTTERSGVSQFFHSTICGAKDVAKKVSETVKDGYKYVKTKLSSDAKSTQPEQPEFYNVDLRSGPTEEPIKLAT